MSAKIGTVRMERNRAIQGQKDMRRTNRELQKQLTQEQTKLLAAKAALEYIAESYPETEEGAVLADKARQALKELQP